MLRRLALFVVPVVFSAVCACTASDPQLGNTNDVCDEDLQCTKPLVCACEEIRGTGDDGNDEIVKHGTCQQPGYKCIRDDAGGDALKLDTAPVDAPPRDSGSDAGLDADETTTDASDATTTDATEDVDDGG